MKKQIFTLIGILIFLNIVSASIVCDRPYIAINYNSTVGANQTTHCSNTANQTVNITKYGSYFSVNSNSFAPSESKDLIISFDSNAPLGLNSGQIGFSDNSDVIQLFFFVNQKITVVDSGVIVFPTAKVVNMLQNTQKSQTIQIIVPSNYPRTLTIQSVNMNPELSIISFGDLNLGQVSPGMTLPINFNIDTTNAQVGSYSTTITILATDSQGQVQLSPINVQAVVSASTNPLSNSSLIRPSCSLSSTTIPLNTTATLTCNNAVNNLQISPEYNTYIQGVNAQLSAGVYTYTFQPIKVGSSQLITKFEYLNSPIFSPDIESFRVIPTTSNLVGGNTLDLDFFQSGIKMSRGNLGLGNTTFLVVDNTSRNIIGDYNLYLNGQSFNKTTIEIELNKVYDLRIDSPGYNTLVFTDLSANLKDFNFNIYPNKEIYRVGEMVTFNSSIENVTYLVDDVKVTNPFTWNYASNHTIKAVKEGYISQNKTVQVESVPSIVSCDPIQTDWSKGSKVICSLSKNVSWFVSLSTNTATKTLSQGESNQVTFTINDYGNLIIGSSSTTIYSQKIDNQGIFNWFKVHWIITTIMIISILVVGLIIIRKRNLKSNEISYS